MGLLLFRLAIAALAALVSSSAFACGGAGGGGRSPTSAGEYRGQTRTAFIVRERASEPVGVNRRVPTLADDTQSTWRNLSRDEADEKGLPSGFKWQTNDQGDIRTARSTSSGQAVRTAR